MIRMLSNQRTPTIGSCWIGDPHAPAISRESNVVIETLALIDSVLIIHPGSNSVDSNCMISHSFLHCNIPNYPVRHKIIIRLLKCLLILYQPKYLLRIVENTYHNSKDHKVKQVFDAFPSKGLSHRRSNSLFWHQTAFGELKGHPK